MTIRDIAIAIGYKVDNQSYNNALASVNKFASAANKILGAVAVGAIFRKAQKEIEAYMKINNQLAYAVDYLKDMQQVQDQIMGAAERSNTAYSAMAGATRRMVEDTNAWKLDLNDATKLAENLGKAFRGAGLSREEAGSMVESFSQNFANGRLSNLPAMLQAAPELVNYLAKSLNMEQKAVRALAQNGNITLKQFTKAINDNLDDIEMRYSKISLTITDSLAYVKDKFFLWLSGDGKRIVDDIARKIRDFGDKLGPMLDKATAFVDKLGGLPAVFSKIAAAAASITIFSKGLKFFEQIKSFLPQLSKMGSAFGISTGASTTGAASGAATGLSANVGKLVGAIGKMSWIVLVIYTAIKTIADIFKFVKGEDSVAGQAYEKRGTSAETAREQLLDVLKSIKTAFGPVKDSLLKLWDHIKNIFGKVFETTVYETVELIKNAAPLLEAIAKVLSFILDVINNLLWIVDGIVDFTNWVTETVGGILNKWLKWVGDTLNSILDFFGIQTNAVVEIADKVTETPSTITNSSSYTPISIVMNNDYTFNGADRANQVQAANAMDNTAEDISDRLKIALSYGG